MFVPLNGTQMYNNMDYLSEEDRKKISNLAIAIRYKVSTKYVQQILKGSKPANSETAKAILARGQKIAEAYNSKDEE